MLCYAIYALPKWRQNKQQMPSLPECFHVGYIANRKLYLRYMLDISKYTPEIVTLCSSLNVKELYLFGSALSTEYTSDSDVDLLVDFKRLSPTDYTKNYFDLKFSLEKILGREIDLLEQKSLRNPYLKSEIDRKKQLLYAA